MGDLWTIVSKELTQLSNRRRFHFEKTVYALGAVATLACFALQEVARDPLGVTRLANFSRAAFFFMSVPAFALTSVMAFAAASGIVLNERIGRRLDLLRITSISLPNIIRGKGLAVMARCMLVVTVLLPVVGVTMLLGGVSFSDVLMVFLMTLATVLLFSAAGLVVSVSSQSSLDRGAKSFVAAFFVVLVLFLTPWWISARPAWGRCLAVLSPVMMWEMLIDSKLSWGMAGINVSLFGAIGMCLLWVSSSRRIETVTPRRAERKEAPGMRDVMERLERAIERRPQSLRVWLAAQRRRIRPGTGWLGPVISIEMRRASILPALIPAGTIFPALILFFAELSVYGAHGWRLDDHVTGSVDLFVAATLVGAAFQGFGMFASEKAAQTVQLVAITPIGGRSMIAWKSAARLAVQGFSIVLAVVLILAVGLWRGALSEHLLVDIFAFGAALVFIFALSASFSLCCGSAMKAAGLFALSLFIMMPLVQVIMPTLGSSRSGGSDLVAFAVSAVGLAAVLLRNWLGRFSCPVLAVGVALLLAGRAGLVESMEWWRWNDDVMFSNAFEFAFTFWRAETGRALAVSLMKLLVASALVVGMLPGFTRALTVEPARGG